MSSILFNIVLDNLVENLTALKFGCPMAGAVRYWVIGFAHDVVILSENDKDFQVLVDREVDFFGLRNMAVNLTKCYVLVERKIKGTVIPVTRTDVNIQVPQVGISQHRPKPGPVLEL